MNIQLTLGGTKYAIQIDDSNYTVVKYGTNKNTGGETESQLGYYTKLPNAAKRLVREEIATSDETVDLSTFVEKVEALNNELISQFEKIKI